MKSKLMLLFVVGALVASALAVFGGGQATPGAGDPNPKLQNLAAPMDGELSGRWFDYKNTKDIVDLALSEMNYNGLLADENPFAKEIKYAVPANPVFVESQDETYPSYYIVNFLNKGKVTVAAIVGVKDNKAKFLEAHRFGPMDNYPPVTVEKAKEHAQKAGKAVGQAKGKLVFKFSKQCLGACLPAWDFGNKVKVSQAGDVFSDFDPESKLWDPQRQ